MRDWMATGGHSLLERCLPDGRSPLVGTNSLVPGTNSLVPGTNSLVRWSTSLRVERCLTPPEFRGSSIGLTPRGSELLPTEIVLTRFKDSKNFSPMAAEFGLPAIPALLGLEAPIPGWAPGAVDLKDVLTAERTEKALGILDPSLSFMRAIEEIPPLNSSSSLRKVSRGEAPLLIAEVFFTILT